MGSMRLEVQIKCINEMKSYLDRFCNEMRMAMDGFQSDIKALRSNGLPEETEESYQQRYYGPANNDVEKVIGHIRGPHFQYLDGVLNYLEKARRR